MRPAHLFWRALFLGSALLVQVACAADENQVIVPASAPAASAASAPASGGFGQISLLMGIALAGVGGWLVWRGRGGSSVLREKSQLTLSETRSLGNRQYLVVASYENKKFLLGVCPGRIDVIAPLHDTVEPRK
jgi:flagellar protein FliO/FliZ